MYKIEDIRNIQLEPSSFCNARCPKCVRNYAGTELNTGYKERNLSLSDIKHIFSIDFVKQLDRILYNGNLGDMIMNPEILEITQWFRSVNPKVELTANTNGGAGSDEFWTEFAKTGITVNFALDGLADTHSLYRQNTRFDRVLHNAKTFIAAGGVANWKMIQFEHNTHQIDKCRQLARELGFKKFSLNPTNRGPGPAFDKNGKYHHPLEGFEIHPQQSRVLTTETKNEFFVDAKVTFMRYREKANIVCHSKKMKELYINSLGEVYPCCFVGHNPSTLDPAVMWHNLQLKKLMTGIRNNALEYPLGECVSWFNIIEKTWSIANIKDGRLSVCDESCGIDNVEMMPESGFTGHGGTTTTITII